MRRIVGIDLARGVAVLTMMTAHVGPRDHGPVPPGGFAQLADGRPSALFVVLAGVSLALMSGGAQAVSGLSMRQVRVRVLVRALLVLGLGILLVLLDTPVAVILPAYAALFVLAVPFLARSRGTLLVASAVIATIGPPVGRRLAEALAPIEPNTVAEVLVGPHYPVVVWLSYLLTGLAVGRSDLRSPRVRRVGALVGVGLVVLGHGGAWLAGRVDAWPATLTTSAPHSSTTFEVLGNTGVAFLAIAACLVAAERWPRAVAPVAAVGSMALTAYTVHVVAIAALGDQVVYRPTALGWLTFLATTVALCWLWTRFLGRGPLERVMHMVSTRAAADATTRTL